MALPDVSILLQNGNLGGVAAFAEGVSGIIGTGVSVTGKIQTGTPVVVYSLDDAVDIGVDTVNNPAMYRQVKEFYDEANVGQELYIMIVPNTMNLTNMADKTNASGVVKMLDFAQGRIRIWGAFYNPASGYTPMLTAGIDADAYTAVANAHATSTQYATAHVPNRAVIEGRTFFATGAALNAANLTDLHTLTSNRAAILIGGTQNDGSASVGLVLGRLSKIPVQRKISRVKDGVVNAPTVYIGNVEAKTYSGVGTVHDKGFITFRTFAGKTGYFFNRDWTATALSDDYSTLSRGRVIDKASVIAYLTYLEELDDEVIIENDGTMKMGAVKYLESKIEDAIDTSMGASNEISSVEAYIDPAQNITTSEELDVVLSIGSVAYNGTIKVSLGFKNPNS